MASDTAMAVIFAMFACKLSILDNKCACVSDTATLSTLAVASVEVTELANTPATAKE